MDKAAWEKKIRKACTDAGTYRPQFDTVIETLAAIMEIRDVAVEQYENSGGNPVVAHTNKGGYTNIVRNPTLVVINEQNQQALAYWRDLGLTPAGYRKLTGEGLEEKKNGTFEAMLEKLEI